MKRRAAAPVFVQFCPACRHPVTARLESRTHEWLLEHFAMFH